MVIGERLAFGFSKENLLCAGFHIHHRSLMIDFFGFYFNLYLGR